MNIDLELNEINQIIITLVKSDPLELYGIRVLAEKIKQQANAQAKPDKKL